MMFGMRGSLGRQLLLPLLLFEVVSLLIIGSIMFASYQGQLSGTQRLQREAAARAAIAVENYLKGFQDELNRAGSSERLMQDAEQGKQALARLQAGQSAYTALALVDNTGRERARLSPRPDAPALPENWAQHPALSSVLSGSPYNGPAEFYGGLPYMVMAIPIRDAELRVVGMLVAQLEPSLLWNVVRNERSGDTGYAYVIDQAANLIMSNELDMVMRRPDVKGLVGVQAALQDNTPPNAYQGLLGQDVIGGTRPVAGTDWKVIAELPTAEAYAALQWLMPLLVVWVVVGGSLAVGVLFYANRRVVAPILEIQRGARIIGGGNLAHRLTVKAGGELADLVEVFNGVTAQLQSLVGGLEQRVAERTVEVERRANQIAAGAEISRAASQVLDPEQLLQRVVDLIRERFDLYYAGVFLVDEAGRKAVLRAGTGEAGRVMLERGHTLEVGGSSMVGWACANRRARIALDVGEEAVRFANPLLPETRSEMALPLRLGERALGALDIQSVRPQAFDENDVTALQGMADQIAVAMENARLFQQAQASLQEVERANRLLTGKGWETFLRTAPVEFAEFHQPGLAPLTREEMDRRIQAAPLLSAPGEQGGNGARPEARQDGRVYVPLGVHGQTIGELVVERAAGQPDWTTADLELLEGVAAQLAQIMDSARLFEESQHLAAREQMLNTAIARIRAGLTLEQVLNTTAQQVSAALSAARVAVRLDLPTGV